MTDQLSSSAWILGKVAIASPIITALGIRTVLSIYAHFFLDNSAPSHEQPTQPSPETETAPLPRVQTPPPPPVYDPSTPLPKYRPQEPEDRPPPPEYTPPSDGVASVKDAS